MPLDGHEVPSIVPSKLWIVILGRRNFVSKGREQDECSKHQVDDMIPLPCWSGVRVGPPYKRQHREKPKVMASLSGI